MVKGRPKGSKNKPKAPLRGKIAERNGSDSDENESEPNRRLMSEEKKESDHDTFSEDNISDADTVIIEQNYNTFGEVLFEEGDNYGPLFCKVAALPQVEIRMTNEIEGAILKAIGKLSRDYVNNPCDEKLFNILVFWKLIKGVEKEPTTKR